MEKTKKELRTDCSELFTCCDCGNDNDDSSCGCDGCYSCNCCESCNEDYDGDINQNCEYAKGK